MRGASSVPLSTLTIEKAKVSVASDSASLRIGTGTSTLLSPAAIVVVRRTPVAAEKSCPATAVSLSIRYWTVTACDVSPVRVIGMPTLPSRSPTLISFAPS